MQPYKRPHMDIERVSGVCYSASTFRSCWRGVVVVVIVIVIVRSTWGLIWFNFTHVIFCILAVRSTWGLNLAQIEIPLVFALQRNHYPHTLVPKCSLDPSINSNHHPEPCTGLRLCWVDTILQRRQIHGRSSGTFVTSLLFNEVEMVSIDNGN